jgi:hypothetical protein
MAPQGAKQKNGTKETKKYPSDLLFEASSQIQLAPQ